MKLFQDLRVPVIAAPMAGGINNPQMVAAVCEGGGVGSFGFAYSSPEKILQDLQSTKKLTRGPINANFFVFKPVAPPDQEQLAAARQALSQLGLDEVAWPDLKPPYIPDLSAMLEPVWQERPAILSFHFGIPPQSVIERAKSLGITIGLNITSVFEARQAMAAQADFLIVQGIEAGGHRGIFEPDGQDENLPMVKLLSQVLEMTSLPLVAAGGIMHGYDVAKVIDLGAQAAQMGTAFLTCHESTASLQHKEELLRAQRTVVETRSFSGRRAQGLDNEFIRRMHHQAVLSFPMQNTLTGPMRSGAQRVADAEYQSLWAGQNYQDCRSLSASQLLQVLRLEMESAWQASSIKPH